MTRQADLMVRYPRKVSFGILGVAQLKVIAVSGIANLEIKGTSSPVRGEQRHVR